MAINTVQNVPDVPDVPTPGDETLEIMKGPPENRGQKGHQGQAFLYRKGPEKSGEIPQIPRRGLRPRPRQLPHLSRDPGRRGGHGRPGLGPLQERADYQALRTRRDIESPQPRGLRAISPLFFWIRA
jgi:hypothetical protein